jgi:hypothetical protein
VRHVPEVPDVPDEQIAGRDAEIGLLREQLAALKSQVQNLAARAKSNSRNSSKPRRRTGSRSRRRSRCAGSPGGNLAAEGSARRDDGARPDYVHADNGTSNPGLHTLQSVHDGTWRGIHDRPDICTEHSTKVVD